MPSGLSNYAGNKAIAAILGSGDTFYLACHASDPTVTGVLATEIAGNGYIRQQVHFSPASGQGTTSTDSQIFPMMPACVVTYIAVWTSISAGDLVFRYELVNPITVFDSGQFLAATGDVAFSF